MKNMKKFLAVILAVVMIMAIGVPAFADDTPCIVCEGGKYVWEEQDCPTCPNDPSLEAGYITCVICNGNNSESCYLCEGSGRMKCSNCDGRGTKLVRIACSHCEGIGIEPGEEPAAPAGNGSITIRNSLPGREYSIYKIFDAVPGTNGHVSYTYDGTLPTNGYFTQDSAGNIAATAAAKDDNGNLTAGAIEFLATLKPTTATATATATDTTLTFNNLEYGYYYIEATGETAVTVDTTMPNVTVIDKNNVPGWDNEPGDDDDTGEDPNPGKVIVNADGTKTTVNSVNYGDTVNFSIAVNAYSYVLGEDKEAELVTYYYITDTLAEGFGAAQNIVVKVYEVGEDGEYVTTGDGVHTLTDSEYTLEQEEGSNSFQITVPFGEKYGSKAKIEVTYSAVVDADGEDVVIAGDGNLNTANFTYSTVPSDPDDPDEPTDPDDEDYPDDPYDPEDPEDPENPNPPYSDDNKKTTTTYVYALGILKVDPEGNPLKGAKFSVAGLQTNGSNGVYIYTGKTTQGGTDTVMEVAADGTLLIKGLEAGTYTLKEEVAPEGYNLLTDTIAITAAIESTSTYTKTITTYYDADGKVITKEAFIAAGGVIDPEDENYDEDVIVETTVAENVVPLTVVNNAGTELPSTGGIGTTIFYVLGGILLVGAAVLLITKKRMSANG